MKINAIVYTSNTGYTAQYAKMLGENTGLPVYTLAEAKGKLAGGDGIVYLGWLMAGMVKDYKKAAKRYNITAVCSVGMNPTGTQTQEVRNSNKIPENVPVFTLQGGYDYDRLRGINKFLMSIVSKILIKKISDNPNKTESDKEILDMLINGGSLVREENLAAVTDWLKKNGICNKP
ncbi:MAG: hypothetical protein E7456_05655 [Ruminococcaceae bacterium]|nr:hypothetical protein [Oscillospiraceae bacterium]